MKLKSKRKSVHVTELYTIDGSDLIVRKNYVDNKLKGVSLEGKGPHGSHPGVVKKSFSKFLKTSNPFHDYEGAAKHAETNLEKLDFDKAVKNDQIFYFYYSGHVLFNGKGEPVSIPYVFDYIGTDFHNGATKLDEVIKVLKKHPWVMNKKELTSHSIPYYNSDFSGHSYIRVVLLPDAKTYNKMYQMALKTKRGAEFFSIELNELVQGKSYAYPKWDPLGIHKFRIERK